MTKLTDEQRASLADAVQGLELPSGALISLLVPWGLCPACREYSAIESDYLDPRLERAGAQQLYCINPDCETREFEVYHERPGRWRMVDRRRMADMRFTWKDVKRWITRGDDDE